MAVNAGRADVGGVPVRLQAKESPRLILRAISQSHLKLTEIRYGQSPAEANSDIPQWGDVFTVGVRLKDETSEISVAGKVYRMSATVGEARLLYLPDIDYVDFGSPRHSLEMLLSRSFLDELAEDLEAPRITRVGEDPGITRDPFLFRFAHLVLPYLEMPSAIDPLWADQFMWAFGTYVCTRHGDLVTTRPVIGGLSRWQERLTKDMIDTTIGEAIRLTELAAMCGLRTSQFAHAFRRSAGISPYQWLVRRRVERVKEHLKSGLPLADIASACGFADQSHMTRTFKRIVGITPAAWRQL
ncbi:AraC family transcriptional regulator [Sphingomonas oleivorans]|uniref:AraC family transcriptional regulator n=1 Tax=Sphingomonas oleivorans TaxID=1735121 RepID=A0A2T5FUQ0_9SPHN|nr:AraC family transcriptional regulator [Sphingomonas oleivorans]PTQ08253.1 AraC family transcriptional regulator [Sphingomonas oleivorans]